jgi:hypothetical protein
MFAAVLQIAYARGKKKAPQIVNTNRYIEAIRYPKKIK